MLAYFLGKYKDELICDFVETYNIYDIHSVPVDLLAILACGLRNTSRIKMKISNIDYETDSLLLASISDSLKTIIYGLMTKRNAQKPKSVLDEMLKREQHSNLEGFENGESFMEFRNKMIRGK